MTSGQLRRDLETIQVDSGLRPYQVVVDEISGRFARVSKQVWQRLREGDDDAKLWAEAEAAGWTRSRTEVQRQRFSLLAIRIPLGGVDWLAHRLAGISAVFFSARAIAAWCVFISLAAVLVMGRTTELIGSLGSLATFLQQANPVLIGLVFVITKACHELGHAVMCRRMGAKPGEVGFLLLCGMPSPYCDVTDIWRQPSGIKRAAVMLAGIYIELIMAATAAMAWCFSNDQTTQLMALNIMIVCGVSTLLFNANPLMRYDGYFVLADAIGSTNLRRDAQRAFRSVVTRRIAGPEYNAPIKSDRRSLLLAIYHVFSKTYRLVIFVAIATLLISLGEWFHVRPIAIGLVVLSAAMGANRTTKRVAAVATGNSRWQQVRGMRRGFCVVGLVLFLVVLLLAPLPRYRRASGIVDSADATTIYLPESGLITGVEANLGDRVQLGDPLLQLDPEQHLIKTRRLTGQLRLARLRGNLSRKTALRPSTASNPNAADQWATLQAAEDSVRLQLASAKQRLDKTNVRAPIDGIVIPGKPSVATTEFGMIRDLEKFNGLAGNTREPWCRISPNGQLHAALVIDARDRPRIQVGSPVMVSLTRSPGDVIATTVTSVSEIKSDERIVVRQAAYQVLCEIPSADEKQLLSMIGQECRGVFRLPRQTFAADIMTWIGDWISG